MAPVLLILMPDTISGLLSGWCLDRRDRVPRGEGALGSGSGGVRFGGVLHRSGSSWSWATIRIGG